MNIINIHLYGEITCEKQYYLDMLILKYEILILGMHFIKQMTF